MRLKKRQDTQCHHFSTALNTLHQEKQVHLFNHRTSPPDILRQEKQNWTGPPENQKTMNTIVVHPVISEPYHFRGQPFNFWGEGGGVIWYRHEVFFFNPLVPNDFFLGVMCLQNIFSSHNILHEFVCVCVWIGLEK